MANIKSQKKRILTNEKSRLANKSVFKIASQKLQIKKSFY
jgi:ribosomal protein S20